MGSVVVDAALVEWAERIAVREARSFRLRSQERDDLKSTAVLVVLELAARPVGSGGFNASVLAPGVDPLDAFKGWATLFVHGECRREAKRLRSGGMFRTCRPGNEVTADPLGDSAEAVVGDEDMTTFTTPDALTSTGVLHDLKPSAYGRTFGRHLRSV